MIAAINLDQHRKTHPKFRARRRESCAHGEMVTRQRQPRARAYQRRRTRIFSWLDGDGVKQIAMPARVKIFRLVERRYGKTGERPAIFGERGDFTAFGGLDAAAARPRAPSRALRDD
jgi:hypothetical protein